MYKREPLDVAVLLATYNGARFIEQQIQSLTKNSTRFTLHWLDDHSTDNSREVVRATALTTGIELTEWHQPGHLGVPATYFQLLELVDADIYLFCDQDDIWQPGKIDAQVESLTPDIASPILCCSDSLLFKDGNQDESYRYSDVAGVKPGVALKESRLFMSLLVNGHTQGFTRPLRDIYLSHKQIARAYASLHDEWMHIIASASGAVRFLSSAPTTLYRWHKSNVSGDYGGWSGSGKGQIVITWHQLQHVRRVIARHAQGFVLAAPTLPPSRKLELLVGIAEMLATIDRRQSPISIARLIKSRGIWPNPRLAMRFAAACLCSDVSSWLRLRGHSAIR
jgi:glycosyltransferase involved in cell wall biosynthesis